LKFYQLTKSGLITSLRFYFAFFRLDERYRDFATTISEMGLHAARAGIDNLERATKNFVYVVISTSRP